MTFDKIPAITQKPIRTSEIVAAGISKQQLAIMVRKGMVHRVRQGYYMAAEALDAATEESIIAVFFPDAVVCRESALFHYGYINRTPIAWHLAFPRDVSRSRFKASQIAIKPYYHYQHLFEVGITRDIFNDTSLRIYDRERTICDCFVHRTSMDAESFAEAIKAYAADAQKKLSNLSRYANVFGIGKAIESLMGVVLNA
jgi:predicted transcriptional regulator of viral defense system